MSLSAPAVPAALVPVALLKSMGVSSAVATPEAWSACLSASCAAHAINTRLRIAAFLANALNETGNLSVLAENLNYSSTALLAQWPSHFTTEQAQGYGRNAYHGANQRWIAELAYGGRGGNGAPGTGDGWLFRGAGCMQTTFRSNYVALAKAIGWTRPLADLPAYLQTPVGAAESAAVFWTQAGCNALADASSITAVRRRVNGGDIGLAPVTALYGRLLRAIAA